MDDGRCGVNIIAPYELLDLPNQNYWNVIMLTGVDQMKNKITLLLENPQPNTSFKNQVKV